MNTDILAGKTQEHLAQSGEFAGVLHHSVVEPFNDLVARAAAAGFDLRVISGYRSFDRQLLIWNAKARGERPVLDDADNEVNLVDLSALQKIQAIMRFSAIPGSSRHHWGTDMDVYDAAAIDEAYQVQLIYSETIDAGPFADLHRWLDLELPKTDFYRPYEDDTGGVSIEPWHLSYKPIAVKYAQTFGPGVLLDALQGVEIELIDSIKANINSLYERFIQVD